MNGDFESNINKIMLDKNYSSKVKIYGFTDDMERLMTISDIFIGKAGGVSLSEALAKGLPIAILEILPGQERYNAEFIVRNKLGVIVRNIGNLAKWINSLLSDRELQRWKSRLKKYGQPNSSKEIVGKILMSIDEREMKGIL